MVAFVGEFLLSARTMNITVVKNMYRLLVDRFHTVITTPQPFNCLNM